MKHYTSAFLVLILSFAGLLVLASLSLSLWRAETASRVRVQERCGRDSLALKGKQERLAEAGRQAPGLKDFLASWDACPGARVPGKELAMEIRSGLEVLAQKKLGLVTDQVTAPELGRVRSGGMMMEAQRVSLRVSGENPAMLLSWLGEAEAAYPLARFDMWEMSVSPGANLSLKVALCHPVSGVGKLLFEEVKKR